MDPPVTDRDDLPIFRPRIAEAEDQRREAEWPPFECRALRSSSRSPRRGRKAAPRSRVAVERPGANARRVVVKAHLLRMSASGAKAAALARALHRARRR